MSLLTTGLIGLVFGFALASPPGPMNAIIAEESVVRGWVAGVRAGLGAFTADACFFVLAYLGVVAVVDRSALLRGLMVAAGGVLMLYFAYGAFEDARSASAFVETDTADDQKGFQKAFVLALTNPYQIVFWLTVGVHMLDDEAIDVFANVPYVGQELAGALVVQAGSPTLIVGFFLGILVWVAGFPATLVSIGRRVDRFAPVVAGGSALVLAGFGLYFLADASGTLVALL
ncbi:LysE family translocator [Haloarchaeobius amylolyticus]|uniref:LysE family translocator n=1 Tax=Haloarchaeobius amylolyticus TaxID=1198296 RepID=UPI00226DD0A3|nr:LysE family transporter [Haloarchaeobius amylolyticus]